VCTIASSFSPLNAIGLGCLLVVLFSEQREFARPDISINEHIFSMLCCAENE
jgi:hypothetical protein